MQAAHFVWLAASDFTFSHIIAESLVRQPTMLLTFFPSQPLETALLFNISMNSIYCEYDIIINSLIRLEINASFLSGGFRQLIKLSNATGFLFAAESPEVASDIRVECNSDEIVVSVSTRSGRFNGMIYPRGLSKNSTCLGEWVQRKAPIKYSLPLRGCNTMSTELVSHIYFILLVSLNWQHTHVHKYCLTVIIQKIYLNSVNIILLIVKSKFVRPKYLIKNLEEF